MQMMTPVTNPDVLAQYPHIAPPRERHHGGDFPDSYQTDPGRPSAGHGRLAQCQVCGTYLRVGQPHSALKPIPHCSVEMMTVVESEGFEERAEAEADRRLEEKRRARGGRN